MYRECQRTPHDTLVFRDLSGTSAERKSPRQRERVRGGSSRLSALRYPLDAILKGVFMNGRERFCSAMDFEPVDRLPNYAVGVLGPDLRPVAE